MTPSLPLVVAVCAAPVVNLPTEVWQAAPDTQGRPWWQNTQPRKDRAVLLVHGLKLHPIRPALVTRPDRHDFQEPKSELVKALAADFDVFGFGYAQTAPLDVVPHTPAFRDVVTGMRTAGYREVVLIGHSAGGVIARQFAESYPDAGVTKVIQVAAPNAGSEIAAIIRTGYPRVQAPFIQSLAPDPRVEAVKLGRRFVRPGFELACVVCKLPKINGDGLVPLDSQWPADLQQQGVPAALVGVNHWDAMKAPASVKVIAELARERLTRWSPEQVDAARKVLFREADEPRK